MVALQPLARLAVKGQILLFLVLHQLVVALVDTTQREQLVVQAVALATMERFLTYLLEPLVIRHQQAHRKVITVAQIFHLLTHGLVAVAVVQALLVALALQGRLELAVLAQHLQFLVHLSPMLAAAVVEHGFLVLLVELAELAVAAMAAKVLVRLELPLQQILVLVAVAVVKMLLAALAALAL